MRRVRRSRPTRVRAAALSHELEDGAIRTGRDVPQPCGRGRRCLASLPNAVDSCRAEDELELLRRDLDQTRASTLCAWTSLARCVSTPGSVSGSTPCPRLKM